MSNKEKLRIKCNNRIGNKAYVEINKKITTGTIADIKINERVKDNFELVYIIDIGNNTRYVAKEKNVVLVKERISSEY